MSAPIPPLSAEEQRAAAHLWEVAHEYLVDSRRQDTTYREQAEAAQIAAGLFTAAQSRALIVVSELLGALVVEQHTANLIAAYNSGALDTGAEYGRVRDLINGLLGPVEPEGPRT
ncbi:hypothetical protein ACQPW1_00345 [Nocardia sp. CA-128927]|uniref:hypothetical protein n=1 Tax=Nocardia sp. CA-128927 TaxID=3239975 RepID=UPI003D964CC5